MLPALARGMWVRAAVTCSCVLSLTGCTLLGVGIGVTADTVSDDRFEERPGERLELSRGQKVILEARDGRRVRGRYTGVLAPTPTEPRLYYVIDEDGHGNVVKMPADEVSTVHVKVPPRGWIYGGLIGAAVDAMVLVAVYYMHPPS